MPIYEYACTDCHKKFEEVILRKSDEAEVRCPKCGSPRIERQMSRPAAATRGSAGGSCGPVG